MNSVDEREIFRVQKGRRQTSQRSAKPGPPAQLAAPVDVTASIDTETQGAWKAMSDAPATPIFLHSSFRTSSTWLWAKFRQAGHARAYYEIFNEALEHMEVSDVHRADYSAWKSKHPVSGPYYLEYLPLIRPGGGIEFFKGSMPFGDFIPARGIEGDLSDDEIEYIGSLIGAAQRENLTPVLTCTRTLGRAKAIRKRFGGHTAIVHRNLFHQWASYTNLYISGHPSFLETVDQTLAASHHDPVLKGIDLWFSDRKCSPDNLQMFYAFLFLHLYIYSQAFEVADLTIDATSLVGNVQQQKEFGRRLSDWVGAEIDLTDVRSEFEVSVLDVGSRAAFFDTVDQVTKLIISSCNTPASVAFVHDMKAKALDEWERHEFFTRRGRLNMITALEKLKAEDEALARRLAEQAADRDALRHAIEAESARAQADVVSARRDVEQARHALEQTFVAEAAKLREDAQRAQEALRLAIEAERARAQEDVVSARRDVEQARHALEQTFEAATAKLQADLDARLEAGNASTGMGENSVFEQRLHELENLLALEVSERREGEHGVSEQGVVSRRIEALERLMAKDGPTSVGERARQDQVVLSRRLEDLERMLAHADHRLKVADQHQEVTETRLRKAEKRIGRLSWNTMVLWPIGAPIGSLLRSANSFLFPKRKKALRGADAPPKVIDNVERPSADS